jgi:hypothetical protein
MNVGTAHILPVVYCQLLIDFAIWFKFCPLPVVNCRLIKFDP